MGMMKHPDWMRSTLVNKIMNEMLATISISLIEDELYKVSNVQWSHKNGGQQQHAFCKRNRNEMHSNIS